MSLRSTELRAANDCLSKVFELKLRNPQSEDLISVSFPAALVTSEENTPATPAEIWGQHCTVKAMTTVMRRAQVIKVAVCFPDEAYAAE